MQMNPHEEAGGECERDPCFASYIQPLVFDMDTLPRYITWKSSHYAWRQWCVPTEMTLGFFLMNDHVYMMRYAILQNHSFHLALVIPYQGHLTYICPNSTLSFRY
jgi:hypothetical protein